MSETSTLIGYSGRTIGREELALVPTPVATETHRPVPATTRLCKLWSKRLASATSESCTMSIRSPLTP
jgi:hypothetical protein